MPTGWVLTAFFVDMAVYLVMVSMPFRALDLGATSLTLGLIPFLYALPYATVAWAAGRRSDRVSRVVSVRMGVAGAAVGAFALGWAPSLPWILALTPILGISLAFHWPALQALVAEASGHDLSGRLGRFNMGWSGGKSLGYLVGGWLTATLGGGAVCIVAGFAFATCIFLVRPAPAAPGPADPTVRRPPPSLPTFRLVAWLANGGAFAVAATLNHHYPRLLVEGNTTADRFGLFLGSVFLSQLVSFVALGRTSHRWAYRPQLLLLGLLLLGVETALVPWLPVAVVLWSGPLIGVMLGFFYQSSLFYSVESPTSRGGHAGIHESVLGISSATVPLLGGVMAVTLDNPAMPFLVTTAVLVLLAGLSGWRFARDA